MTVRRIARPDDLDSSVIVDIARGTGRIELADDLKHALVVSRRATLDDLAGDRLVYGVNTGMGALSGVRLDAAAQARHQDTLMTGRAVGSAPWLRRDQARALIAARLRTFLHPSAGVSVGLCEALVDLLNDDIVPAIPARGSGAAGEIIPLAHAGSVLLGRGEVLEPGDPPPPRSFGAKEGIAFLEGVPGLTGMSALASHDVRRLLPQVVVALAGSLAVAGASRDPLHPALADSVELGAVLDDLRSLRGDGPVNALQAPVSYRVSAPALAVAMRAVKELDAAVDRALGAVTDSPAHLGGEFVGTFGFAGTELAAALGALTTALVHLAELGAARLHRLLDPAVTGLNRQLAASPGVDAGLAGVHKRAVGVAHRLRRFAMPALVGAMETSLGQEDVQSFGFEAVECVNEAITGLRDVLACELLALVQARRLSASLPSGAPASLALTEIDAALPAGTTDRPYGRDLDKIVELLESGSTSAVASRSARVLE
ncbi:aromatic amino acid lyase [Actinoplanes solisilvae]|uniref:aromatic amino acid lyase n=1 Tax=Actinoplanes solisilvae TaxID=2486853 RepID=UPI000FD7BAB1|nr:aromatic amino acid lyase [Actinoplanes solisilvae]